MRGVREHWFYDEIDVSPNLRSGENLLAVSVWSYGWSTYQTIASTGGLCFELSADGETLFGSDGAVRCHRDDGHQSFMPKRNVNLGFTDSYDAGRFSQAWIENPAASDTWAAAAPIRDVWGPLTRSGINGWNREYRKPQRVLRAFLAENGCQQVSVNTRSAFFGDRRETPTKPSSPASSPRFSPPRRM